MHSIVALRSGILEDAHAQQARCSAEQRWVRVLAQQRAANAQQRSAQVRAQLAPISTPVAKVIADDTNNSF